MVIFLTLNMLKDKSKIKYFFHSIYKIERHVIYSFQQGWYKAHHSSHPYAQAWPWPLKLIEFTIFHDMYERQDSRKGNAKYLLTLTFLKSTE